MTQSVRPRRSALYLPGSNPRALEKAKTLPADTLILDLEDAVAPESKESARAEVCEAVANGDYGAREVVIRVNGLETPWGEEDIIAAVQALPDALLVPKISSGSEVGQVSNLLDQADAPPGIDLWVMMETPLAMLNARKIAAASVEDDCRLSCFVMGTNDLAKEISCAQTKDRSELMTSLSLSLLAARAYGLTILDGVYNDIQDSEGFVENCHQGANMGFDGKTLIHPSQLAPCNEIFAPTQEEVAWSRKILAAFQEPENAGKGVIKVDGRMVELLHAEVAQRVVNIAEAIEALEAG